MPIATETLSSDAASESASTSVATNAPAGRRFVLAGACLAAFLTAAFTAIYWNRFLAPSAGATPFYVAQQLLQGRMPYRDFLFLTPPLHVLKAAALIELFGSKLIVTRLEALIERTVLAAALYLWLSRVFRSASTLLAVVLSMIVFAADGADSLAIYHHDSVFWSVLSGFCVSCCLDATGAWGRNSLAVAAGFLAALSFLTKQTTGLGILAAIVVCGGAIMYRRTGGRIAVRFLALVATGWAVPIAVFLLWLQRGKALGAFLRTMLMTSTSKGTWFQVLSRPFLQFPLWFVVAVILTLSLGTWVLRKRGASRHEWPKRIYVFAGLTALAITMAYVSASTGAFWPGSYSPQGPIPGTRHYPPFPAQTILYACTLIGIQFLPITGSAYIVIRLLPGFLRDRTDRRREQILFLAAVSLGIAYMLSLSWAIYCPMVVPGVALVVAAALERLDKRGKRVSLWIVASLVVVLIYATAGSRFMKPYSWMYWAERPVTAATHESSLPELEGLRLSEPTLSVTERVTALIRANTPRNGTLLVYPYFPLFYVVTGLRPPTYAFNHYIDVCPDSICEADAKVLQSHPPDTIVYMVEDDEELTKDEQFFRGGAKSGSRVFAGVIETLARDYRRLDSVTVPGSFRRIEVYCCRDPRPDQTRSQTK
jgi:hypothetical protein